MTIAELIRQLGQYPQETIVLAHDPDTHLDAPVTGMVYDKLEGTVYLYTEDDTPQKAPPRR